MQTWIESELRRLAPTLRRDADGVWRGAKASSVSYPHSGHGECFAIEDDSYWFAHRNAVLTDLLLRYPPSGLMLDVGGGNGAVAAALSAAGWPVVLVEPGEEGVRNARHREIPVLVAATFEEAGFAAASVPAIGVFDVVEHVRDDVAFLTSLAGALAPGGRLYVTVPALRWLWSRDDVYAGHARRYSARRLLTTLAQAGLNAEWCSYFFSPLPLPILFARTLPSLLARRAELDVAAAQRQHRAGRSWPSRLLVCSLAAERQRLASGRCLPWGSSLIAVARRKPRQ